jgi:hypothetical protein
MIPRKPRPRLPNGVGVKKRILVEGLALIRLLRSGHISWHDAEADLGIPRREFYRYLHALRLARAPLQQERIANDRSCYSLPRGWP